MISNRKSQKKKTPPKKKPSPASNKKTTSKAGKDSTTDSINVLEDKSNKIVSEKQSLDTKNFKSLSKVTEQKNNDISTKKEKPVEPKPNNTSVNKSLTSPLIANMNRPNTSPLGRIEIKSSQPHVRVGLSRNSKVKPLHPNVKPS